MVLIKFLKDCRTGKFKKGQIIECSENFAERQISGGFAEKYILTKKQPEMVIKEKKVKTFKIKKND